MCVCVCVSLCVCVLQPCRLQQLFSPSAVKQNLLQLLIVTSLRFSQNSGFSFTSQNSIRTRVCAAVRIGSGVLNCLHNKGLTEPDIVPL